MSLTAFNRIRRVEAMKAENVLKNKQNDTNTKKTKVNTKAKKTK